MKKCFVALLFFFVVSPSAPAQNTISTGEIAGWVADPSGARVSGAAVIASSVATGARQIAKTNEAGLYLLPLLSPGSYNLSCQKAGFKTAEIRNVIVQVGQTTDVVVALEVGSLSESVTITASGQLLHPTESSVSTVVNQTLIDNLPLNGRRFTDLILLTPNATADGDSGLVSIGGQQGGEFSGYANGNGANSFTVDGANATSNFVGGVRGTTRIPYLFGEQSIQEFQVAVVPFSAVYGGAGSGFVNAVTKSGSDSFHGDLFYFNRNSATAANDAISKANGFPKPLNILQQFGADLGGPLIRHRAWFYFDYEQQRQTNPISIINPGFAAADGTSFENVLPGTVLPPPNGEFPTPASFGSAPSPGDSNYPIYLQQVSNALHVIHSNLGQRAHRRDDLVLFPKLDWHPSESDRLTFVYNYNRFSSPGGVVEANPQSFYGASALPNNYFRDHQASVHWTHLFGEKLVSDLHTNFVRGQQIFLPSGLLDPNLTAVNLFTPEGFLEIGNPYFALDDTREIQWEFAEQLNYIRGQHNFQFGFDINRSHISDYFPGDRGTYTFSTLTDFALGRFAFFTQEGGNPTSIYAIPFYGFYMQDKWQALRSLTLDLGVREDFQVFPQQPSNPAFPLTGRFPNQYQRVSPRIGFAYQPFSKMVVRGGFGTFFELLTGLNYERSALDNGLASEKSNVFLNYDDSKLPNQQLPTFPARLSNSALFAASPNVTVFDPGFRTPSVLAASLEVQQELLAHTTLTFGTMWTHGIHLISSSAYDLNLIPPTGTTTYIFCPAGTFSISNPSECTGPSIVGPNLDNRLLFEGRISSTLQQINALITPGLNQYNSFYVLAQRRATDRLNLLVSYTLSKNINSNGVDFNNQFDFSNTREPSLLNQRQRISLAAVYAPDANHVENVAARNLLSRWIFSTVAQFGSGRPYTAILNFACTGVDFGSCNGQNGSLNNSAFNQTTTNSAAGLGPVPGVGFNAFNGPWVEQIDLGISRSFHVTGNQSLVIKAQVFNLFNHANFLVQNGQGINPVQYNPIGPNCGDGATLIQTCYLVPNPSFRTLQSISQLNGPRVFQFGLNWEF